LTVRNAALADDVLARFADIVVSEKCIWFVGSGFSLPQMPSAPAVARTIIENAFGAKTGGQDEAVRVGRWETLKLVLLGREYQRYGLKKSNCLADVYADISTIDTALSDERQHQWTGQLLNLGRVADVIYRTAPPGRQPDLELASLMGLTDELLWGKKPGLTQHLLSLIMMEGLVQQVITTNYDSLLEDAYADVAGEAPHRIRTAEELSDVGNVPQDHKPTVYKIHGCRGWYVNALKDAQPDLEQAASALVVTDRQLQHWRDTRWNWARDLLTNSLRQHPFLFIGFSGADPILGATLNAVAEEPRGNPPPVFVCKELTFPLFQFLSHYPGFDPQNPGNLLPVNGEALMTDLYPVVIAKYFTTKAAALRIAEEFTWDVAQSVYDCFSEEAFTAALVAAPTLLGLWAGQVADSLIDRAVGSDPTRIYISPTQLILSEFNTLGGYKPLRTHDDDYRRLVGLLSIALAKRFGDPSAIRQLDTFVKWAPDHSTLVLGSGHFTPVCVVLIPSRTFKQAEGFEAWLQQFFETREQQGADYEPEFLFLYAGLLDRDALRQVWARVASARGYAPLSSVHIWSCAGYFNAEEVYPHA
jgi:hypothetical protein